MRRKDDMGSSTDEREQARKRDRNVADKRERYRQNMKAAKVQTKHEREWSHT